MPSFEKQLWLARGLFIVAIAVLIAAHFLPLERSWTHPSVPEPWADSLMRQWQDMWNHVRHPTDSTPAELQSAFLFFGTALLLLGLPFLSRILSRTRTFRWLAFGALAAAAGSVFYFTVRAYGRLAGSGSHLLIAGFWLALLGLLFVPDARPGAGNRWKLPRSLALFVTFLLGSPHIFPRCMDHYLKHERLWQCQRGMGDIGWLHGVFAQQAGRYPTFQEGWQPLLVQPATWPFTPLPASDPNAVVKPWHPFLTGIPLDPWGAEYELDPEATHAPLVFSKGPDGIVGTEDDVYAIWKTMKSRTRPKAP